MNVNEYIRIPYLNRGRTEEGCDCWGLVMLVMRNEFGKELPDFEYESSEADLRRLAQSGVKTLKADPIIVAEDGDLVLMDDSHVGIIVLGHVLHTSKVRGTVWERLDSPRLRGRGRGVYRVA